MRELENESLRIHDETLQARKKLNVKSIVKRTYITIQIFPWNTRIPIATNVTKTDNRYLPRNVSFLLIFHPELLSLFMLPFRRQQYP